MTKMTKSFPCRILAGDRITIPKQIFKDLKLYEGDWLIRKIENNALIFTPTIVVPRDTVHSEDSA